MQPGIVVGFVGWSLHCGKIVRRGELVGGAMRSLCCAVWGIAAWSPPEGGPFPPWVTRRLSGVAVAMRPGGWGAL